MAAHATTESLLQIQNLIGQSKMPNSSKQALLQAYLIVSHS
jgi:hypothetical protein